MECPNCDTEMEEEEAVDDYHDPSKPYGHGQTSYLIYVCPKCGKEVEDEDCGEPTSDELYEAERDNRED